MDVWQVPTAKESKGIVFEPSHMVEMEQLPHSLFPNGLIQTPVQITTYGAGRKVWNKTQEKEPAQGSLGRGCLAFS